MTNPLREMLLEDEVVTLSDNEPVCIDFADISDFTMTLGDLRKVALSRPVTAGASEKSAREMLADEERVLRYLFDALRKIADYSPASTVQPVAIAREALAKWPNEIGSTVSPQDRKPDICTFPACGPNCSGRKG